MPISLSSFNEAARIAKVEFGDQNIVLNKVANNQLHISNGGKASNARLLDSLKSSIMAELKDAGITGKQDQKDILDATFKNVFKVGYDEARRKAVGVNGEKLLSLVASARSLIAEKVGFSGGMKHVDSADIGSLYDLPLFDCQFKVGKQKMNVLRALDDQLGRFPVSIADAEQIKKNLGVLGEFVDKCLDQMEDLLGPDTKRQERYGELLNSLKAAISEKVGKLDGFLRNENANLGEHPLSENNVNAAIKDWITAGGNALEKELARLTEKYKKDHPEASSSLPKPRLGFLNCENPVAELWPKDKQPKFNGSNVLSSDLHDVFNPKGGWFSDTDAKALAKLLIARFSKENPGCPLKLSAGKLSSLIKEERMALLESADRWGVIKKDIHTACGAKELSLQSVQTPASKIGGNNTFRRNIGGRVSGNKSCPEPVNCWKTELKDADGQELFAAMRHGVCSPDALSGVNRCHVAIARARGLCKAAFLSSPKYMEMIAKDNTVGTKDNPIELNMTSVSLLSRRALGGEGKLFKDQYEAFNSLNKGAPLEISVNGRTVYVKPKIMSFNFGVQFASTGKLGSMLSLKNKYDREVNKKAFKELKARVLKYDGTNKEIVRKLYNDVVDRYNARKEYSSTDLYSVPSRIALLTYLMGDIPAFNCKSGKDRTGQMDVECKFLSALLKNNIPLPKPGAKLTPEQSNVYRDIVVGSGNLDIQQKNTGLGGYKTVHWEQSNIDRLGGDKKYFEYQKGGESVAKS